MSYFVGDIEKTKVTDFKTASSPQEVVSYLSSWERLKKRRIYIIIQNFHR